VLSEANRTPPPLIGGVSATAAPENIKLYSASVFQAAPFSRTGLRN
jgi:hypothetical protein